MYHVSAQGIDECMINVHYYYYSLIQLQCETHPNNPFHSLQLQCILVAVQHLLQVFMPESRSNRDVSNTEGKKWGFVSHQLAGSGTGRL